MAKSSTNQLDRSRPSSRLQPQGLLETTPILFRLPNVQVHPLPLVEDLPAAALQQAQAEVAIPTAAEPVTAPVLIVSQPTVAAEEKQSWWEHWSSGIVLIVLLVALYITSILVLKSRSQKLTNTLANEKAEIGDLANIEVPQIHSAPAPAGESAEKATTELTLPTLTLENSADTKARAEELVGSISNLPEMIVGPAVPLKTEKATSDVGNSSVSAFSAPLATAQLLEPTQMPQTLPLLQDRSPTTGSGNVSAQPVSSPIGHSPALYDGATKGPEHNTPLAGTNSGMSSGLDSGKLPDYSQGYSQAQITRASIPNLVLGANQQTPVASTVSAQQPAVPPVGETSGGSASGTSTPRLTSTPDANGEVEAIIKAYLELMRAGRAVESTQQPTTTAPANRYQPTR